MAELDLGEMQGEDYTGARTVDFLFNGNAEKETPQLEPIKQDIKIAEGFFAGFSGRPGDTVLPVMPDIVDTAFIRGSGTAISFVGLPNPKDQSLKKKHVEGSRQQMRPAEQTPLAANANAPFSPNKGAAAASEIFDHFFTERKYQEAEAVLQHSSNEQMFEWWRVRYERLRDIVTHDYKLVADQFFRHSEKTPDMKDLFAAGSDIKHRDDHAPMQAFSGDFRRGFVTEILAFANHNIESLTTAESHGDQQSDPIESFRTELSSDLLAKLLAMPVDTDQQSALFFDLVQSFAASSLGESLLEIIEKKNLKARGPEWFGLYLDALLRSGFARKVIVEALLQVEKKPYLAWIRVVWRRLPAAWDAMGVTGFLWSEDDGAKEFLNKVNVRGQQLLRTFIDDKKMRI
jgi:hypothetical protein